MSFFKLFKNKNINLEVEDKGFEVSDCNFECDSCNSKFPKSMEVDQSSSLWDTTKPYDIHFIISTGKTDWERDPASTSGKLPHAIDLWIENKGKKHGIHDARLSVSSLSSDALSQDEEYETFVKGDVLLLPYFIWLKNVSVANVLDVLSTVVPDLIEARKEQRSPTLNYDQFPSITLEVDKNMSYIFLCSHRTRDKRCGITAPIMKKELDIHLRDLGLIRDFGDHRPKGVKVAYINHVGGHKYVANVIIYLKESGKNIWLARCTPKNVKPIVDECVLNDGKIWPDHVRLIQKFDSIDW